jgi:hypothetical protein
VYFYEFLSITKFLTHVDEKIFKVLGIGCNRLLSAFHSGALMLAQPVKARLCVGISTSGISASAAFDWLAPQLAAHLNYWRHT